MHVQNLLNSLWDIRIFLGLVPKESPCIIILYVAVGDAKQQQKKNTSFNC